MGFIDYRKGQRGEGAGVIILYVAGIGVAWLVINFLIGWIYGTKEVRVEEGKKKKNAKHSTTTTVERTMGGYTAEFNQ